MLGAIPPTRLTIDHYSQVQALHAAALEFEESLTAILRILVMVGAVVDAPGRLVHLCSARALVLGIVGHSEGAVVMASGACWWCHCWRCYCSILSGENYQWKRN